MDQPQGRRVQRKGLGEDFFHSGLVRDRLSVPQLQQPPLLDGPGPDTASLNSRMRERIQLAQANQNPSTTSCVLLWNHHALQSLIPHIQSNFRATKPSPDGASGMLREPGAGVHSHQQAQKKLKSQQNHQRPLKAWCKGTLQHMMKKRNFSFG